MRPTRLKLIIANNSFNKIYQCLLIILFFSVKFTYAQNSVVDSFTTLLSSADSDAKRIVLMNDLSGLLRDIDIEQSVVYAQKSLELTRKTNDKKKEVEAILTLGKRLYETAGRDSAFAYFEEGEALAKELGFKELQADYLIRFAKWYRYYQIDSTKAVNYFLKSLEVSQSANYHEGTGRSYAKLASFYTKYKHIELCKEYLKLSAKHYLLIENGSEEIAHYYNEVGDKIWDHNPNAAIDFYIKGMEYSDTYPNLKVNLARVHSLIGEPNIALKYLEEAFPYIDTIEQKRMRGLAFSQLVEAHIQLNNFQSAEKACDEGISFLKPLGRSSKRALPILYRAKGIIAEQAGDDEVALAFYTKSMEEATKIRYGFDRLKSQLAIGTFYLDKDLKKSKDFCSRSYKTTKKNKYTSLEIKACDCLYKVYKKENSSAKALKYFEQKIALSDSLNMLSVKHALEINTKIAAKDKQLAAQSHQKEIKDTQLKNQYRFNKILLLFSLIGLFLIGFLIQNITKVRRQNIEITEKTNELKTANMNLGRSNEELERFAFIASHDLKSPLRNIISFTGLTRRKLGKEKDVYDSVKQYLDFIETNGKRMNKLIEDLLEYSKLSKGTDESEKEVIQLNEVVNEIAQIAINNSGDRTINIETSNLPNLEWNSSKIYLLFKNLIENGLKYNESEVPSIKINYSKEGNVNTIYVEDNGIGIEQEYFDKVFVLFKRLHTQNEYEGTGLGLATCKKIVDEFKGNISMSSEIGKGTIFKIELPNHLINNI